MVLAGASQSSSVFCAEAVNRGTTTKAMHTLRSNFAAKGFILVSFVSAHERMLLQGACCVKRLRIAHSLLRAKKRQDI